MIHFDQPDNIEQFVQEIGRAGRDGLDAKCLLLYRPPRMGNLPNEVDMYCATTICRHKLLANMLDAVDAGSMQDCGKCDNCVCSERTTNC